MPMLAELQERYTESCLQQLSGETTEEVLVPDTRCGMKSKQFVEEKFGAALIQAATDRMERRFESRRSHLR